MTNGERQSRPVAMHGMEALTTALRDPSVPIFRRTLFGRLEPMALEEACRRASRGDFRGLFAEIS